MHGFLPKAPDREVPDYVTNAWHMAVNSDRAFAKKLGISRSRMPREFTPEFKLGADAAAEALCCYGRDLQVDQYGHATVMPRSLPGCGDDRMDLKEFLIQAISYRYKAQSQWSPDFCRGVDAYVKSCVKPYRKFFAFPLQRQFRDLKKELAHRQWHPIFTRLRTAWITGQFRKPIL